MNTRQGITTTAGIAIIAIVIVAVGVAVFFVYQSTQSSEEITFSIESKDRLVLQVGQSESLSVLITSSNTEDRIDLAVSATEDIEASLPVTSVSAGDQFSISVMAVSATESGKITLIAEQSGASTEKNIDVRIFTLENTNSVSNTNIPVLNTQNTNTITNVNGDLPDFLRVSDTEMNFTMVYPAAWGEASDAVLELLAPLQGNLKYVYLKNLLRFDLPGHVSITATSADYIPTEFTGTPYWFTSRINPELSEEQILEQIRLANIEPLSIEKVTIDGRAAIKAYTYRGYINHYLDVNYLLPMDSSNTYDTMMILRTIDIIAGDDDTAEVAIEKARVAAEQLKAGKLDEQAMRRYNQFEEAIKTFEFLQ